MQHRFYLATLLALLTLNPLLAQDRRHRTVERVSLGSNPISRPHGYEFVMNGDAGLKLDPRLLPLTINPGNLYYHSVVNEAVVEWNNVGLGQLFQLTSGPADLTIDWTGSKVSEGARAETRLARSPQLAVPVTLSIKRGRRTDAFLRRTVLHELGHVLGLAHSENVEDIMFESEQPRTTGLTARDRSMLIWLYTRRQYTPIVGLSHLQSQLSSQQLAALFAAADGSCQGCPNSK